MNRKRLVPVGVLAVATLSVPFAGAAAAPESGGGEVIDGGTFVGGPPEHIDPALNTTLDAYQVINALYDGLTDIDVSDPENTRIVPLLAESYEPNEDATVWTFTIRDGLPLVGDRGADGADRRQRRCPAIGGGGEIIDGSTFVLGVPNHIDPQLNTELDSYQVINALYDGLTDIDATDPENVHTVPHQAESYEPNEDATVWTFTIRDGLQFADGEPILPSTYKRSWERAAALGGDYSYLLNFIEGGAEALEAGGGDISGVVADDEAMTLTVTLSAPYANFDAVAGFQMFLPTPGSRRRRTGETTRTRRWSATVRTRWRSRAPTRRSSSSRTTTGPATSTARRGTTEPERIMFLVSPTRHVVQRVGSRRDRQRARFRRRAPRRRARTGARRSTSRSWPRTTSCFNPADPRVGGEENMLLRQAISQAIDRDAINEAIFNGMRTVATGITPPGIPGFAENLCDYCAYDPDAAQAAFDEWTAAGNALDDPLPIQFAVGGGHEAVVDIIVENLAAIGIEAEPDGRIGETYFAELTDGACVFCRDRLDRRLPDVRQLHVRPLRH